MLSLQPYDGAFAPLLLQWIPAFFGYHQSLVGGKAPDRDSARLQAQENLAEWQQPPSSLYVILWEGQAAGFIRLCRRGDSVIWIEDIFVQPQMRGQGIASAAIGAAERIAAGMPGCEAVCMDVVPRNQSALRLYHRLGYRDISLLTLRKELGESRRDRPLPLLGMDFRY